jgi:hypothetical protein
VRRVLSPPKGLASRKERQNFVRTYLLPGTDEYGQLSPPPDCWPLKRHPPHLLPRRVLSFWAAGFRPVSGMCAIPRHPKCGQNRPPFRLVFKKTVADQWHNSRLDLFRTHFCPHIPPLPHNLLTVLAGPGAHRVSGRTAVTSRHGIGTRGSEGVRRAGIPERSANAS